MPSYGAGEVAGAALRGTKISNLKMDFTHRNGEFTRKSGDLTSKHSDLTGNNGDLSSKKGDLNINSHEVATWYWKFWFDNWVCPTIAIAVTNDQSPVDSEGYPM